MAWKFVVISVELISKLEITTKTKMSTVIPMVNSVFVLKFMLAKGP
jgi:hypothetical protein